VNLKLTCLVFILVGYSFASKAQQVYLTAFVKSAVKTDSTVNATLRLYLLPDSSLQATQVAIPGGNKFTLKPSARYLLKVTAIGYETQTKLIVANDRLPAVSFLLKKNITSLNEVVVKSKKTLLTQEDDKTIVDPTELVNTSTNAYEVLEKTPGAIVDQDGNIYLNSATPATVYINGREMKMSTEDIAALLKSLPAGSISKIEILRTPSAKYDATNSGGIVNIVLKKGIKIGTTGSFNLRQEQGVYHTGSAGFTINRSAGKLSAYISYQFTKRNFFEDIISKRLINNDTLLDQRSYTTYSPVNNYFGGGLDLSLSRKFNLGYDIRLTANTNNSKAISNNDFTKTTTAQEFIQSETPISNKGNSLYLGNSLSAKYKIDTTGSEWTTELNYSYSKSNNTQLYTNNYYLPAAPAENGDGTVHNIANSFDLKSDLVLKLKYHLKLESGFKFSNSTNNNEAAYYSQKGASPRQVNTYQTNTFNYTENITSLYLQLSKLIWGFTFKAGLRLENTNISGHQEVPGDTSFSIKRTDLFPYFYLKHDLFKIFGYPLTVNAIYRKSISRPGYDALNPSPKFVDQFLYDVGNTRLQPQFTTNYELNVSYNDFPAFAVGINETKNIFSRVTYQNEVTKISYRTYDNLGRNKEFYFRLFGATPQGKKFFMYAGVQYNYLNYDGYYQGSPLQYKRGSWSLFSGQEIRVSTTMHFNLNAWMYINGFRAFNELKNMGQLNLSATKMVLHKKLSIILSGSDVLLTNKAVFHIQQGTLLGNGSRIQDSRRVGITLRYNFGIKPKEEKKPNEEQPQEGKEN
jgi:hypothetical protein